MLGSLDFATILSGSVHLAIFGIAIVMWICVMSWNAAAHRRDGSMERSRSIIFYALTTTFLALLVQATFFQS